MAPRRSTIAALALATLTTVGTHAAQAQAADTSIFAPLTLAPAPSQTRLANGAPGPKYWQNRADYDITATLDTTARAVHGSMSLRYTNNSPDTLHILWIQTEQDPNEHIDQFTQSVNGRAVPLTVEQREPTETKVTLAEPLKPGTSAMFQVAWQFSMHPGEGGGRMGRRG
ncbi:MAG TPA: hypothetical protein VNU46_06905, partial [Gemmatimonadaceae bacterium]|nr:hypothetical protein [Gemmatimonadaceae bacterium]